MRKCEPGTSARRDPDDSDNAELIPRILYQNSKHFEFNESVLSGGQTFNYGAYVSREFTGSDG